MELERDVLSFSPWDPVVGCMGMVQNCAREVRMGIRKHFFAERVAKHCNKLPKEVVDAPSLSVLKEHLHNALNNM